MEYFNVFLFEFNKISDQTYDKCKIQRFFVQINQRKCNMITLPLGPILYIKLLHLA